jgi:hypothetical protein
LILKIQLTSLKAKNQKEVYKSQQNR